MIINVLYLLHILNNVFGFVIILVRPSVQTVLRKYINYCFAAVLIAALIRR